ncbi:MAG: hypothetical protein C0492_07820 [Verminephrobacter sp.]|nr:hypothetical protein [Verminephrobacter sp.]
MMRLRASIAVFFLASSMASSLSNCEVAAWHAGLAAFSAPSSPKARGTGSIPRTSHGVLPPGARPVGSHLRDAILEASPRRRPAPAPPPKPQPHFQERSMTQALTTAQREELKALLAVRRRDLQAQMQQNRENLAPPAADQDGIHQGNVGREVDQALTDIDAADLARIDHALEALEDGSYGQCGECGCDIPFERLKIEPQTQHCVACKSRWEQSTGHAKPHH